MHAKNSRQILENATALGRAKVSSTIDIILRNIISMVLHRQFGIAEMH